ncbi:MAG: anti-sigma factor domain-containing protein [Firmicutes bacterium]|nr:anti-sigma factor domain-containing protein [Bacillota bacterium]
MGKGILLERDGRYGVVLTPQGEFRRVRLPPGAAVGEEVEFRDEAAATGRAWWIWAAAAAVLALAILAGPAVWRGFGPVAVATISVDINPSAEFDVDREDRVLAARPLNDDAAAILADLAWRRQPADEVVARFVAEAARRGKLAVGDPQSAVVIAVAPVAAPKAEVPPEEVDQLKERLEAAAARVVPPASEPDGGAPGAQLVVLAAPETEVEAARAEGLSLGRHLLYAAVREERPDLPLTPAETRQRPVGELVQLLARPGEGPGKALERLEERLRKREKEKREPDQKGREGRRPEGEGRAGKDGRRTERDDPGGRWPAFAPGRGAVPVWSRPPDRGSPERPDPPGQKREGPTGKRDPGRAEEDRRSPGSRPGDRGRGGEPNAGGKRENHPGPKEGPKDKGKNDRGRRGGRA